MKVSLNGILLADNNGLKASELPPSAGDILNPRLVPPSVDDFRHYFSKLALKYHQIIGVFIASGLNQCYANALEAAKQLQGIVPIQVIDSQTVSIGLGLIVQAAAENLARGAGPLAAERVIRSLIPRTYSVFCPQGLSYLYYNGFIDHAQAMVSEMLGLFPLFVMEEGRLSPLEKVRNHRHVVDYFIEFIDEFDALQHIALLQSAPIHMQEAHLIREHAQEFFQKTPFTAHSLSTILATLLGPKTTGVFVVESGGSRFENGE